MKHIHYFHVCRIYNMKGTHIGELEELVLLMVGILYPEAYGVAVMDELEKQAGRSLNISAIHAVLTRLEEKGLLKSKMSSPTEERGGRRKRIFVLTAAGKRSLEETNELRNQLFNRIPPLALQFRLI
ncbi:transcriptional regulator, PadR family [Ohtaekwangia koreensis]|uniref:Transcriptional regulator, PadR family n=2 Tax=Ohtaekwangia koreensis TaxID=688867 RepID=A0A1T5J288_9BACT|nr:transcriptional regulator, PadR family [Ohtaekwangia koreensis]